MGSRSLSPAVMKRVVRARDRLQDAPHEAPPLPVLAGEVGLSRAHLLRSFAQAFGVTPHVYLTDLRLRRAKRALARGLSVTEACFEVGFSSLGSFSRLFTQRVGLAPRDWQRRVRTVLPSAELWPAVWIPGCFLVRHAPSTFGQALFSLPAP
jgi:AraC-like DNA-binding protein